MATMTKEQHDRQQRRRMRQLLGMLLALLVLAGVIAVGRGIGSAVGGLFDKTDEYASYASKLEGLVMFDPMPFDGIENMDDITLRSAAVWGTVYSIMNTDTGFDSYQRDPETDMVMLPSVEVDAYLTRVLGPEFRLEHHSFDMEDMSIQYDSATQCYLIPVTSSVGAYNPKVVDLFKRDGRLYVTVGYVPVVDEFDITTASTDQPVKYMDYIFSRSNGNWYLTALAESAKKPEAASVPASAVASSTMADSDVQSAILAGAGASQPVAGSAAASAAASGKAASDAGADAAA